MTTEDAAGIVTPSEVAAGAVVVTVERAWAALWAAHLAAFLFCVLQVAVGVPFFEPQNPMLSVPVLAVAWALQLRHSRAAAEGERVAGPRWSWLVVAVITLVPVFSLGANWTSLLWVFIASSLQLLPVRVAVLLGAAVTAAAWPLTQLDPAHSILVVSAVVEFVYFAIVVGGGGAALWASARLVREIRRVEEARTAFAALDLRREQLRLAGDVHDLLGQTLTAIALRGDVGRRQLPDDPVAAAAQAGAAVGLALDALGDLRRAAYGERTVTLAAELDGSRSILAAAGLTTIIEVDAQASDCPDDADAAMAWCVREAATNVVRHAPTATWCRFSVVVVPGGIELHATNDGADSGEVRPGNGLRSLAERAADQGGRITADTDEDVFRLRVELPWPSTEPA